MKNKSINLQRRHFIQGTVAAYILMQTQPLHAFENLYEQNKIIWVFLRGAMDALHTVVPVGDPNLASLRKDLLDPIKHQLKPLSKDFALHPDLPFLHKLFTQKQMSPVLAVASGYRERSHFDAQDQMESGLNQTNHDSGWLARALQQVSGKGVAIARSVPIALRGVSHSNETWFPSIFPEADTDLLERLQDLYSQDAPLSTTLSAILEQKANPAMQMQEKQSAKFPYLAQRCGELLSNDNKLQCAMLEMGGWDTHNNQANRMSRQFKELDNGLQALKTALGKKWNNSLVIVSTEFGRTVALNGTKGTDHGTASAMLFAGGAMSKFKSNLKGGKILGKWPGLQSNQLFEQRDLMPTSDVRTWLNKALQSHWGLSKAQLTKVFPDLDT